MTWRITSIQFYSLQIVLHRLHVISLSFQRYAQIYMGFRISGVQFDGFAQKIKGFRLILFKFGGSEIIINLSISGTDFFCYLQEPNGFVNLIELNANCRQIVVRSYRSRLETQGFFEVDRKST